MIKNKVKENIFIIRVTGTFFTCKQAWLSESGPLSLHWAGPQLEKNKCHNKLKFWKRLGLAPKYCPISSLYDIGSCWIVWRFDLKNLFWDFFLKIFCFWWKFYNFNILLFQITMSMIIISFISFCVGSLLWLSIKFMCHLACISDTVIKPPLDGWMNPRKANDLPKLGWKTCLKSLNYQNLFCWKHKKKLYHI